jgi:RNA polymerase sigma factor (sigma-70 family)
VASIAFETLLDRHGAVVMRYLVARLGPDAAEDAFQESMLSALRSYPQLREPGAARAWLLRIAERAAHDSGRDRARRPVPVEAVPEQAVPPPPDLTDVWSVVGRLPPKQRTALALRFAADLAYREIADVMETSSDAARRNVHEGLKALREQGIDPA